jgi:non-specific protein-tyrosine kinase
MELREYWAVVRKHLWILLLTTAIGAGAAFYFSYTAPSRYRATTTLELDPTAGSLEDPSTAYSYVYYAQQVAEQAAQGFAMRVGSPEFVQAVKDRLEVQELNGSIEIQQVQETQFLRISAESEDPALAQALANTAAQVLIEQETSRQQTRIREALDELEAEIASREEEIAAAREQLALLGPSDETTSEFVRQERSRLESALNRNETRLVVLLDSAEDFRRALTQRADYLSVYTPAQLPRASIGPSVPQRSALGAATGLMIGLGLAFLIEYLDDTIRTPEDVKRVVPVGVLGALPRLKTSTEDIPLVVARDAFQPISEAFRSLRTSVRFSAVDEPLRTLLVTSPLPTDGKTFTAANLAAVMAQGGRRVILVDADLRHPMQHEMFGMPKEPGISSAMLWEGEEWQGAELDQLFTQTTQSYEVLRETEVEQLRLVTCGKIPHNPAELIASQRFAHFVSWLRKQADVVIFDSPPVLAVTDAPLLASQVDGVILVVDSGETRRPAAVRAVERLHDVGANVLGVVINRLSPSSDGYYNYYYYHGSYYGSENGRSGRRGGRLARLLGRGGPRRANAGAKSRQTSEPRGGGSDA